MNEISKKIKTARENKNWSQSGLAAACKCSVKTISRAENDCSKISKETLNRIIEILELDSKISVENGKVQLNEVKSSHALIQSVIDSSEERNFYPSESIDIIMGQILFREDFLPEILKRTHFILDDFSNQQLQVAIEFVSLIEKLTENTKDFELTSQLLKTQHELNLSIENLNKEGLTVFYKLRKDRIAYGGEPGVIKLIKDWCREIGLPKNHLFDSDYFYNNISIPTIYIYDSKNPDIKIKNNHKSIIVEDKDYSSLKFQRKCYGVRSAWYVDYRPLFTPEEKRKLDIKFQKELAEKKSYRFDAKDFDDDEFPFGNNELSKGNQIVMVDDDEFPF